MMKRICAIFMTVVLVSSLITVLPAAAADNSEIQLLSDLDIIKVSETSTFFPESFTREDFAVALNKLDQNISNFVTDGEEEGKYAADIAGNKNYGHIATLIKLGYMETDSDNNFNPSSPVSKMDVLKALICALGYDPIAERDGGKDSDYERLANKLELLKGVRISDSARLTSAEVAEILANAMSVSFFSPAGVDYGNESFYSRWNIVKRSGKILANSNLGLVIERTNYKEVNIDGRIYHTELLVEDNLVGSVVEYYTVPGDYGDEVVSIYTKVNNNNITIEATDIEDVTEDSGNIKIVYDEGDKVTVSKTAYAIVNGITKEPTKELFEALKSGTATFIDSDSDGDYDVIHMTILLQGVLDGVNPKTETLMTRYDGQRIELEDVDRYEIYLNKKAAELADLSSGMVVGIACDSYTISGGIITYDFTKASYIKLYASERTGEGVVSAMLEDAVEVDGMEYSLGAGYTRLLAQNYINAIKLGDYVELYLDAFGDVAYYEIKPEKSSLKYGYLIKSGVYSGGIKKYLEVKIMDVKGDIAIFKANDKFILDGVKVDGDAVSYNVAGETADLTKRQIVRYRVTDGILKELDTQIVRAGVEDRDSSLSADLPFDPYTAGNEGYSVRNYVINRQYGYLDSCIVFVDEAPISETDPSDYNFSVKSVDSITGTDEYSIAGYDANSENLISCVVNWPSYGSDGIEGTTVDSLAPSELGWIVEKIKNAINQDGEEGYKIYLTGTLGKMEYFIYPGRLKLYAPQAPEDWGNDRIKLHRIDSSRFTETVKSGDVIRMQANSRGEIYYIEKNFDFERDAAYSPAPDDLGITYGFAKVEKISGTHIFYNYGAVDPTRYIVSKRNNRYKDFPVYYVESGETELVSFSQIPSAATGNDVKMFIRYYGHGEARDFIIYVFD